MCTVSYLPTKAGVLICSNRDESSKRSPAIPPQWYLINGNRMLFPKDPDANGTWITMKPSGDMAVLLNGGWEKHVPVYPYRKSRGLIFLDICSRKNMVKVFDEIEFENIEPFTLLLFQGGRLIENRWDGLKKYQAEIPANLPHIWSSVTLYDAVAIQQRTEWFEQWLIKQSAEPSAADLQAFHRFGGKGDDANALLMNRNNELFTVSITCMEWSSQKAIMHYNDLIQEKQVAVEVNTLNFAEITS